MNRVHRNLKTATLLARLHCRRDLGMWDPLQVFYPLILEFDFSASLVKKKTQKMPPKKNIPTMTSTFVRLESNFRKWHRWAPPLSRALESSLGRSRSSGQFFSVFVTLLRDQWSRLSLLPALCSSFSLLARALIRARTLCGTCACGTCATLTLDRL